MKRQPFGVFGSVESDLDVIVLSQSERDTLRRAGNILGQLRDLRGDQDDELGMDIALAMYACQELSSENTIRV